MNIIDVISESRIDEFYIPGGAQQEFVSSERMLELKLPANARFRPWGTNTNPWTYSSDNMKNLAIEAMQIFAPYYGSTAANRSAEEISASIVNYWKSAGAQQKANIQNMFSTVTSNAPQDAPFLHNEALGMMLNSLQLSTNDAAHFAANDEDADDTEDTTPE
jgi:hypothetical protein